MWHRSGSPSSYISPSVCLIIQLSVFKTRSNYFQYLFCQTITPANNTYIKNQQQYFSPSVCQILQLSVTFKTHSNTFKIHSHTFKTHSRHINTHSSTFKIHSHTFKTHSKHIHTHSKCTETQSKYIHIHTHLHTFTIRSNTFKIHSDHIQSTFKTHSKYFQFISCQKHPCQSYMHSSNSSTDYPVIFIHLSICPMSVLAYSQHIQNIFITYLC